MKNLNMNSTRIATIVLAVLLVSSTFMILDTQGQTLTTAQNPVSQRLNPVTGMAYGDLMQYEWPTYGADGGNTRYNAGPAPNAAISLWNSSIPVGVNANGVPTSMVTAFNGMVFYFTHVGMVALNATTGAVVWQNTVNASLGSSLGTAALVKINENFSASIGSQFITIIKTSDGTIATQTAIGEICGQFGVASIGGAYQTAGIWPVVYDPVNQTLITTGTSYVTNAFVGVAISLAQPATGVAVNATAMWSWTAPTGVDALCIGDGYAYFGSFSTGQIFAFNEQSGSQMWTKTITGTAGGTATYADGMLYHDSGSGVITALEGSTGTVKATFQASGAQAYYNFGCAAAYGRIFDKCMQVPQSSIGSWDGKSLVQQWRQTGNYSNGFMASAVADRKLYITQSEQTGGLLPGGFGNFTGYSFAAFDAFSGVKLWNITNNVISPIVAFGCLYAVALGPDGNNYVMCYGDLELTPKATTQQILTQDWNMFHGPLSADGNATGCGIGNYPTNIRTATWSFLADSPTSSSPVIANGKAYFGSWKGTLYCVDALTGTQIWSNHYNCRILSTPTVVDGVVYTGPDDGNTYALNATDGTQLWKQSVGGISDHPVQSGAWQVIPSAMVGSGKVFISSEDANLYCFNQSNGAFLWMTAVSTYANGVGGSPSRIYLDQRNRTGFCIMAGGNLRHIDINGTIITSTSVGSARGSVCTPIIVGQYVFITYGNGAGTVACYSATNLGTALATRTLAAGTGASTPMAQTPTFVQSQLCFFRNNTNIGYSGAARTLITHDAALNCSAILDCVYVAESTDADCNAIVFPGQNLGGNTNADQFIVNATSPYFIAVWHAWAGHQVYASATVAINPLVNPLTPIDYIGNAAYGFTAYNGSSGEVLSTFTATAQVFGTAALWNNRVYVTANDGYLYCFAGAPVYTPTITAASDKGDTMNPGETTTITGSLTTTLPYYSNLTGENTIYQPGVPFSTVKLTWVNPDQSSTTTSATTDAAGNFTFSYTPTQTGASSWVAYYEGATPTEYMTLNQIYTAYNTMNVGQTPTSPTPTTSGPSTTPEPVFLPIEYIYAIAGVIVALIVIVAVVMLMRKRKK